MYIANVTNDFYNITSSIYADYVNFTSSNDIMTLSNCTFNENDIDIIIPTLMFTKPCGLSFSCLMSLKIYILIKPPITIKRYWKHFITNSIKLIITRPIIVDKTYALNKPSFNKK